MCGHFPEGVETFEQHSIEGETRGEWYLRQMLGSANISGSKAMHLMTGNLSHQIEHHLFPDLPSNRYQEIAPEGAGALRALRADLHHRPAAQAGRLGVAQGLPALAAQPPDRTRDAAAGPRARAGRRRLTETQSPKAQKRRNAKLRKAKAQPLSSGRPLPMRRR